MKDYPVTWTLRRLFDQVRMASTSDDGVTWRPARPLGYPSLGNRIRSAWLVFTGKADVLLWPTAHEAALSVPDDSYLAHHRVLSRVLTERDEAKAEVELMRKGVVHTANLHVNRHGMSVTFITPYHTTHGDLRLYALKGDTPK